MRTAVALGIALLGVAPLLAVEQAHSPTVAIKMSLPTTAIIDPKEEGGAGHTHIHAEITITNKSAQAIDHAATDYKFKLAMKGGKEVPQDALMVVDNRGATGKKSIPAGESLTEKKTITVTQLLKAGKTYVLTCEVHGAKESGQFKATYRPKPTRRAKRP